MYHNFEEFIKEISKNTDKKIIAVAAAHDSEVLACAALARNEGIAACITGVDDTNRHSFRNVVNRDGKEHEESLIEFCHRAFRFRTHLVQMGDGMI